MKSFLPNITISSLEIYNGKKSLVGYGELISTPKWLKAILVKCFDTKQNTLKTILKASQLNSLFKNTIILKTLAA